MTVWVSPRGNAHHELRVRVNVTHGNQIDIADTAVVAVRPTPCVIAGELSLGLGERFSADVLRPLALGSYALIPRRQPHFTRYAAGTIVQVHGIGPLVINYVDH